MNYKQKHKQKVKERIRLSNEAVANGLDPDPWVVKFRLKNNVIKAKWKANQPKSTYKPIANSGSFVKGHKLNPKRTPEQVEQSKAMAKERVKIWQNANREKINKAKRDKRNTNHSFRIACNLRKRLSFLVKINSAKKTIQTLKLLGCSLDDFMIHLQSKFKEGMSFENYGQWHIDHKIPCNHFDLTDIEQQKICFHYTNLQPLWAKENRAKSDKIIA